MNNHCIWITGASRGIGAAIAGKMAATGSTLILSARNNDELVKTGSSLIPQGKILTLQCDITSAEQVNRTYRKIEELHGIVDILINNAGVAAFKPFSEYTENDLDLMLNTNFKGTFLCTKAVLPAMLNKKKGMIININSVAAFTVYKGSSLYSASKAAALMLSRTLREEVRGLGIKVIDILPGATLTDIWDDEDKKTFGSDMMLPEDIATTVSHLVQNFDNDRMLVEEVIIRPQKGDI